MSLRKTRLLKELAQLENNFSHEGIKFISQENFETLKFEIIGPEGTPFSTEILQLELKLTGRYTHTKMKRILYLIVDIHLNLQF